MLFLYSLFFAGGAAAFIYTKMGRRLGYGNSKSVLIVVGVAFVFSWIVFWTFAKWVLHLH